MSEAAKPADPERALARLELLMAQREALLPGYERRTGIQNEQLHGLTHRVQQELLEAAEGWLLPLARAGLEAERLRSTIEAVPVDESAVEEAAEWFAERDALRAEFEACVRVLARLTEIDVLSTDGVTYRLTASSVAAIALAQPLAAAVLRHEKEPSDEAI